MWIPLLFIEVVHFHQKCALFPKSQTRWLLNVSVISLKLNLFPFWVHLKGSGVGFLPLCDAGPLMTVAEVSLHTFTVRVIKKRDQQLPPIPIPTPNPSALCLTSVSSMSWSALEKHFMKLSLCDKNLTQRYCTAFCKLQSTTGQRVHSTHYFSRRLKHPLHARSVLATE